MKYRKKWAYDKKNELILQTERMVQELGGNWKQPIFHNFEVKMQEILLLNIILEYYKIGFRVVAPAVI